MKGLVKYTVIFVLVICGILIAGTVVLHFANLDPFRERIESMAENATGRRVAINGHVDINLFPHPAVSLNDVTIANAKWGSEPVMARVGHVDGAISFLSLFSDTMIVRRVRLKDVSLLLERNAQNVGNWVMDETTPPAGPKENIDPDPDEIRHLPLMVYSAEFSNITVTSRVPESPDQIYSINDFSLQPDRTNNLILKSSGEVLEVPVTFTGMIANKETIADFGAVKADLTVSFPDVELTGQLSTRRLATLADLQGTLNITIRDIAKMLKRVRIQTALTGPLTANAEFQLAEDAGLNAAAEVKVEGITANVEASRKKSQLEISAALTPLNRLGELFELQGLSADALRLKANVTGSAVDDIEIQRFEATIGDSRFAGKGHVDLKGRSEASFVLQSSNPSTLYDKLPEMDVKVQAKVQYTAEKIAVPELDIRFDKSDIRGDITIVRADKHNITANLKSKLLDLRPLSKKSQSEPAEQKAEPENRYVFKEIPLPLEALEGFGSQMKLSVDHFYYDAIELKNAVIDAAVHNGNASAKVKFDSANKGHAAAKIDIVTQDKKATVDALLSLSDFRIKALLAEDISPEEVPPLSVSLEIATAGSSPRELASVANGRVLLTQGSGKINNSKLGMFTSDIIDQLIGALNPLARNEKYSNWDCSVLSLDIVDGRVAIDTLLAQGEKVLIVGGGAIDLKTEKLDVEFNTKPRTGVGISADMFVTPFIKVKGTLASPAIGLNKKGTLLSGGAAIATGGLSLLAKGLFDRATAQGDHCEEALKNAGNHIQLAF